MDRTLVRISAYFAFGFAVFLVALVLTFPDERIKQIATVQLESQLGNKYDVEIEDLDLWWLSGVALENVTLTERQPADGAPQDEKERHEGQLAGMGELSDEVKDSASPRVTSVTLPEVGARFAPASSLFNLAPTLKFQLEVGGGEIVGEYVHGSDKRAVNVTINEINLNENVLTATFFGAPLMGTLAGEANLELHATRPLLTGGHINLTGKQLMIEETTIESDKFGPMAFIDIPQTSFGSLDGRLVVENGGEKGSPTLTVEEFRFHDGRDVRGQVWGDIDLAQSFGASRPKLKMRFQFDDKFVRDNDLSSVLRMKWFRDGKNEDWYGFVLLGRMSKPRFDGAPSAGKGPQAAGADDDGDKAERKKAKKRGGSRRR